MTVTILTGDCRDVLATLPADSINCCVTSPPYFGLRDYGVDGQIGLEDTPSAFVEQMVGVFREVRRVLRPDGTLWLNLGDSYASDSKWGGSTSGKHVKAVHGDSGIGRRRQNTGLKSKDLIGIPWRVAFALQDDGWYLRQDIIWSKPNPMPESVTDRCTKAHEYLFLLAKSGDPTCWNHRDGRWAYVEPLPDYRWRHRETREETVIEQSSEDWRRINLWRTHDYYFDQEAIAEPLGASSLARLSQNVEDQVGSDRVPGKTNGTMKAVGGRRAAGNKSHKGTTAYEAGDDLMRTTAGLVSFAERERAKVDAGDLIGTRNKRSVWTVATQPFKEAHFATFPPKLIEDCIKAGCPMGGMVLDPFGGAGTTGLCADRLGRKATLIELNPKYVEIARRRINKDAGMFGGVAAE